MRREFGFTGFGRGNPRPSGGPTWTPASLGASLLGFWDAERADLLTLAGSLVETWTDSVGAYAPTQATTGFKPVYSATSLNNRPGLTFDGTDDFLSLESTPFPIGADPVEVWVLASQGALPADTTDRWALSYGGTSQGTSRRFGRSVVTGVNRARCRMNNPIDEPTVDFSGIHLARYTTDGALIGASVDGSALATLANVPATTALRLRFGGSTANTPTGHAAGTINFIIVVNPAHASYTAQNIASLVAFGKARGGIP